MERQGKIAGKVQAGGILVDGLGVGDVGNIVLNDRKLLSQNGLIIATVTLQKHGNMILAGPDIVSRGFVYVRESRRRSKTSLVITFGRRQSVIQ